MNNVYELENKKIAPLLWKYFLPSFTGVIINSLYNIVDRVFIGQGVGAFALSGLSAVFPVLLIIMAFGMLIGMGAGVRISINIGKKDFKRAELVLGNALVLNIIISIAVTALGFVIKTPMLKLFGASDTTIDFANEYLNIILLGTILNTIGFSLNNLIRSEGNAKIAMYSMIISAGTNIILDPIFIFGLGMGIKGAAYATIISMAVLCFWVLAHFRSSRSVIKLRPQNLKLNPDIIKYILTIGFAPFAMQLASSFVQGTLNTQLINYGGDLAVGAMGIINSMAMFIVMSIFAINMGAQPIIGFNFGAKKYDRVKETFVIALKAASLISIMGWILVQLFPTQIIMLFNKTNKELLNIGTNGIKLIFLAFPIVGFQVIVGNYFQSIGNAKISAFLSLLRQVFLLIPAILIFPRIWGLNGVWLSAPIADSISAIIVFIFMRKEIKLLNKKIIRSNAVNKPVSKV